MRKKKQAISTPAGKSFSAYIAGKMLLTSVFVLGLISGIQAQEHPRLMITPKGVEAIREGLETNSLFKRTLKKEIARADREIQNGISVPIPRDLAGGYTHERHKRNYVNMQRAGLLYQITGEDKYAKYVKDMLLQYAGIYPKLPLHPKEKSYARGKLFWQCLNDANWLVYTSQAYDCVYEWLSRPEREKIEKNLFRPYADFLSIENPQFYNRTHNHSAWGNAAVGMIGLVMNDEELVNRALYGYTEKMPKEGEKDDDGGAIRMPGQKKAGFFAQLDNLFSPDGYYTEGPYYQRYALYPLIVFAVSLENYRPDLKVFEYRDGLLQKTLYALINLTDSHDAFYPINDAQKGMSCLSTELVTAVDAIYYYCGRDPQLLSIAKKQKKVTLDNAGFSVAMALAKDKEQAFEKQSVYLSDGKNGDEGGVAVLRSGEGKKAFSLVYKYTGQGMGHGHFDKLSISVYNEGAEVLQDYGVARFVNIEQKDGGGYLPENKSFAKQTIAHNTLTVNQTSNFKGSTKRGEKYHSAFFFFDASHKEIQIVSAFDSNAYPGVLMKRTLAMLNLDGFNKPLVVDLFKVESHKKNLYDLPYYYKGQVMMSSGKFKSYDTLLKLGDKNGYQHLWKVAEAVPEEPLNKLQWLDNNHFYTLTTLLPQKSRLILGRIGASDPNFNLRNDPVYIIRTPDADNMTLVSVLESHGKYSPVTELASRAFSQVQNLQILFDNEAYTAVKIEYGAQQTAILVVCNSEPDMGAKHKLNIGGQTYKWTGPYHLEK